MNRINWRKEMLSTISSLQGRPRLLLHVCCAPCSSGCLEELCAHFDVTCFYYNPNISPAEEYVHRGEELCRLVHEMPLEGSPDVVIADYDPETFYRIARGLEDVPEGGVRCEKCYLLRLEKTAQKAKKDGYAFFTTTLSISPLKNADKLNTIGGELASQYGVPYLYSDFKKADGYLRSIRMSETYGLYRQDYCGCVYSRLEAAKRKDTSAS